MARLLHPYLSFPLLKMCQFYSWYSKTTIALIMGASYLIDISWSWLINMNWVWPVIWTGSTSEGWPNTDTAGRQCFIWTASSCESYHISACCPHLVANHLLAQNNIFPAKPRPAKSVNHSPCYLKHVCSLIKLDWFLSRERQVNH